MLELQKTFEGGMEAIVNSEVPSPVKQRITNAVFPFYKSLPAAVEQLTERLGIAQIMKMGSQRNLWSIWPKLSQYSILTHAHQTVRGAAVEK
jgi:hypothetical protein